MQRPVPGDLQLSPAHDAAGHRQALVSALAGVAQGDEAALAELYKRTSAKLFGICHRILGDRGEAEDILQDVYVTVWRKAGSFDALKASPITWLATLARNRAIDRIRSIGGRVHQPLEAAAEVRDISPDAEARIAGAQETAALADCIDELEAAHANAIRAAFFEGVTYSELAARSNVPAGTMKSWIRRALLKLRACLAR